MKNRAAARIALACFCAAATLGAYAYGQGFGQTPAKLNVVKVKDDL